MQKGQKLNRQHHKIEFKLPDGFLGQLGGELDGGIPRSRVAGAMAAGAGSYLMVRVLQKTAGDFFREIPLFLAFFPTLLPGVEFKPGVKAEKEQLLTLDPMAIATGLLVGGLVMADINPGEILKGIGEIIPG